jgi:hypothetical protein
MEGDIYKLTRLARSTANWAAASRWAVQRACGFESRLGGQAHEDEVTLVEEVVLATLIYHPDQIVLGRFRIREDPIHFAED